MSVATTLVTSVAPAGFLVTRLSMAHSLEGLRFRLVKVGVLLAVSVSVVIPASVEACLILSLAVVLELVASAIALLKVTSLVAVPTCEERLAAYCLIWILLVVACSIFCLPATLICMLFA